MIIIVILMNHYIIHIISVPDWGIAVIVVGAILLVAFIFCFLGLCFACQTSQSKNVTFGSMSSINTER